MTATYILEAHGGVDQTGDALLHRAGAGGGGDSRGRGPPRPSSRCRLVQGFFFPLVCIYFQFGPLWQAHIRTLSFSTHLHIHISGWGYYISLKL
jgi:hypothetical protein